MDLDIKALKEKYDISDIYGVISDLPGQIRNALRIGQEFSNSLNKIDVSKILFAGMGGSAIGGNVIQSLVEEECKIPINVIRNYRLPEWADENTLAVISSYSGNTEESLSAYEDAVKRSCRILCATTGGKLESMAIRDEVPVLKIPTGLPPRGAIAYSAIPWLVIFSNLGFISDKTDEISNMSNALESVIEEYGNLNEDNPALELAQKLQGKIPLIYVSTGAFSVIGRRWANQIQENAKMLAYSNEIPEMNHNEIMGWHLKGLPKDTIMPVFISSDRYYDRVAKRFEITSSLIEEKNGSVENIVVRSGDQLMEIFTLISMGDFVSYYLALLNGIDPEPVDIISELKNKLSE